MKEFFDDRLREEGSSEVKIEIMDKRRQDERRIAVQRQRQEG
jgi:hypothetical protein